MATVVVADDNPMVRQLFRLTLEHEHTLIEAEDGGAALDAVRRDQPDVVILDVVMPVLSGLQVCRLLRADPDFCNIGIIVVSANASAVDVRQAGADLFIAKPFLPSTLLATVRELVQQCAVV